MGFFLLEQINPALCTNVRAEQKLQLTPLMALDVSQPLPQLQRAQDKLSNLYGLKLGELEVGKGWSPQGMLQQCVSL